MTENPNTPNEPLSDPILYSDDNVSRTVTVVELDNLMVCPECGEYRPDDLRVESGMKCSLCAYGSEEREEEDE